MSEPHEDLEHFSEDQLEQLLLDASGLPGRAAIARVTALRTILRRRAQATEVNTAADARRALELVNATRTPDRLLRTEDLHPVDAATVLAAPEWAALVVSDAELRAARAASSERVLRRNVGHAGADA